MPSRKALFVLLLIALTLFISGCQENMSAEEIATKMQEKEEGIEDYSYTMYMTTYLNGEKAMESEMATMYRKPNLMKSIGKEGDEEVTVVSDGEFVWSYNPGTNMVTKIKLPDTGESPEINYLAIVQDFLNESEVSLPGTEEIDGRPAYLLELSPKENEQLIGKTKVWVDKETWMPTRIELYDNRESLISEVELRDLEINTGIPESEFVFEVPEGAEIKNLDLEKDFEAPEKLSLEEAKAESSFEILLPEYLPEDYAFNHSMVTNNSWIAPEGRAFETVFLIYVNEADDRLSLSESLYEEEARKAGMIDLAENVSINGKEGKYMEVLGDRKVLKWEIGEMELTLRGTLEKAELLKVAESIHT
ncbi:MAG: outer membrane lipoprotein-sorting protein [Methanosarcinaceae archaeon]|nr:outer membrane lipoprotein-sorting protein [Methanosarcinaceae archaeon]MDD4498540.1 outer membrane lipoprotein-sorting protein [Methanosarcinaceae archaeon]